MAYKTCNSYPDISGLYSHSLVPWSSRFSEKQMKLEASRSSAQVEQCEVEKQDLDALLDDAERNHSFLLSLVPSCHTIEISVYSLCREKKKTTTKKRVGDNLLQPPVSVGSSARQPANPRQPGRAARGGAACGWWRIAVRIPGRSPFVGPFHHLQRDKGEQHGAAAHTGAPGLHIVHHYWSSFMAAFSVAGVQDWKGWIRFHGVVVHSYVLTDTGVSLELTCFRIMIHAYPHLLPNKLKTQTLGLFYYHRLIPVSQIPLHVLMGDLLRQSLGFWYSRRNLETRVLKNIVFILNTEQEQFHSFRKY